MPSQCRAAFFPCALFAVAVGLAACRSAGGGQALPALRLATTTSTADSGLLAAILPAFEAKNRCTVDVVAVGTGQAMAIGRRCDADVLLVHAREQEDRFVADGFARQRFDVMYNDFILVGPRDDPAHVQGKALAADAMATIMARQAPFVSRGDRSGTNAKEMALWNSLGVTPTQSMAWYHAIGQGMGDALLFAHETNAYTLTDRGTYLAMRSKLPNLVIIVGGSHPAANTDPALRNPYGVMAVSPDRCASANYDLAMRFVAWILSAEAQKAIEDFGKDAYGQPLFYPSGGKESP